MHGRLEEVWENTGEAPPPGAADLLAGSGLRWEGPCDVTLVFRDATGPAATASFQGKIIKGVAVRPDLRGTGAGREAVGRVLAMQRARGILHSLVFTSPGAAPFFRGSGFREVSRAGPWAVLLETGFGSFDEYLHRLRAAVPPGAVAAVDYGGSPARARALRALAGEKPALLILAAPPGRPAAPRRPAARESLAGPELHAAPPAVGEPPGELLPGLYCPEGGGYFLPLASFPSYYLPDPAEACRAWAVLQTRLFLKAAAALSLGGRVLWTAEEEHNRHARPLLQEAGLPCLEEDSVL